MIYLLDTNAISVFLREKNRPLRDRVLARLEDCRLSAIVLTELEYGVAKHPEVLAYRRRLDELCRMFPAISVYDEEAAFHAGRTRAWLANLKPNAAPIGDYDVMLAGHALALGATIVTHNVREFSRVPNLQVEDWQSD